MSILCKTETNCKQGSDHCRQPQVAMGLRLIIINLTISKLKATIWLLRRNSSPKLLQIQSRKICAADNILKITDWLPNGLKAT